MWLTFLLACGGAAEPVDTIDTGATDTAPADTADTDTADSADTDTADTSETAGTDTADGSDTADTGRTDTADTADTDTADTDCRSKTWYRDADGDGSGDPADDVDACDAPEGYTWNDDDCDDTRDDVYPRAPDDDCDGVDQDCDGEVDEASGIYRWRTDADGDGFGDEATTVEACAAPPGMVLTTGDCDDADASISPGAREVCDGIDQDCDGWADDTLGSAFYADTDGDGYGDADVYDILCSATDGWVSDDTDCDDTSAEVSPGASEVCDNAVDDDCDGTRAGCGVAGTYDVTHGDLTLTGDTSTPRFGASLAALGDQDGDGFADVLVGARGGSTSDETGSVYLFRGPLADGMSPSDAALVLTGADTGYDAGPVVGAAGDTTGDGVGDVLVTAYAADGGGTASGAVYLVDGTLSGTASLAEATTTLYGEAAGDRAGFAASGLGDIDGDGLAEVLVGAPAESSRGSTRGAVYVVSGGLTGELDLGAATAKLYGESLGAGRAVAGVDLDGDGVREAVVASSRTAYVVSLPVAGTFELADADATITPTSGVTALANVGDTDGDGLDDLALGDEWYGTGAVRVYTGPLAGALDTWAAAGSVEGGLTDMFGSTIAAGGDVDADGYADLVATAPAGGFYDRGDAVLVYGPVRGTRDAVFEVVGWESGISTAVGVGDTDGDGFGDVLVGSAVASDVGLLGAVHVFLGGAGW